MAVAYWTLYGRDLLLPLNGHLDETSGGAGLKAALCTGKPKEALSRHPPTTRKLDH
jgi:hypothetical protein